MAKNIMICCDGTGCEYGKNNSNVVKIYGLARKDNAHKQICYYDPGVGTGGWKYDGKNIQLMKAQAIGTGVQKNINDAYKYLMRCYEPGDKIYLFGFSRGAFTVRSLGGMLYKCGLLYPRLDNMLEYAAKMYNTHNNDEIAAGFKETFSRSCPVHFIGVWDTVKSLMFNAGKRFHNAKLNPEVKFGYHAVALDEARQHFPPYLWEDRENIEQVWFAGAHSDVGGWHDEETGLSDIALEWMVSKAKKRGVLFDEKKLSRIKGDPFGEFHNSYTGMWKFVGKHVRELSSDAKIHPGVKIRLESGYYKTEAKLGGKPLSKDRISEIKGNFTSDKVNPPTRPFPHKKKPSQNRSSNPNRSSGRGGGNR